LTEMNRVLAAARAASIRDSWVSALETCVRRNVAEARRQRVKDAVRRRIPPSVMALVDRFRS